MKKILITISIFFNILVVCNSVEFESVLPGENWIEVEPQQITNVDPEKGRILKTYIVKPDRDDISIDIIIEEIIETKEIETVLNNFQNTFLSENILLSKGEFKKEYNIKLGSNIWSILKYRNKTNDLYIIIDIYVKIVDNWIFFIQYSALNEKDYNDYLNDMKHFIETFNFLNKNNTNIVLDNYKNKSINYYNSGIDKAKFKKYEDAISEFNKAIDLNPNFAEAYNNRGNAKDNLNKVSEAIIDYNKAIEIDPNFAEAYFNRGLLFSKLNQYEKSISDYSEAIKIKPDYSNAYKRRGISNYYLKKYNEALLDFNTSIKLDPYDPKTYLSRGLIYILIKSYDESISDFNKAINLGYKESDIYYYLSFTNYQKKDYISAYKDIKKSLRINPNNNKSIKLKEIIEKKLEKK